MSNPSDPPRKKFDVVRTIDGGGWVGESWRIPRFLFRKRRENSSVTLVRRRWTARPFSAADDDDSQ